MNTPDTGPALRQEIGGPYMAVVRGGTYTVFRLPVGTATVGRLPELEIPLDHVEVSRRHCEVQWDGAVCTLTDLGSRWGTVLNGERLTAPRVIGPGDRIEIGPITLLFGIGEPPDTTGSQEPGTATEPVRWNGELTHRITLSDELTLGRDPEAAAVLNDPGVSRRHAVIRRSERGFRIEDLRSTGGSFVNGHRFDEHELVIGDQIQIGPYVFRFDGRSIIRVPAESGGGIEATGLAVHIGAHKILNGIDLSIGPGQFVGIIGASGAGKSTLLDALSGSRPPSSGRVTLGGQDIYGAGAKPNLGFVPQDDIVHRELRVAEALRFAARLRLPKETPPFELHKLVVQTLDQLGLRDRAAAPIHSLSGGQRKRVSVGAELLARPPVLFLDEPTSGLDPATEFKLMESLRDLADSGCTIICTTHVMENVYLMDRLVVIDRGQILFCGTPAEARAHFGVQRMADLYERIASGSHSPAARTQPGTAAPGGSRPTPPPRRSAAFWVLLQRLWAILKSDWRNFAILLGQPALIGALVAWVSDDASLLLFFAYIAALWLGCGNAAQEIVREIPIYRRERLVGVGRTAYLSGKFLFLSTLTILQAFLLYAILQVGESGLGGSVAFQTLGLAGAAASGVGIGCAISALARTEMQAVLFVPLILIPLILFSGHPVPANEMKPPVHTVSRLTPGFSAQTLMDSSFIWGQEIARDTLSDHWTSFRNLNRSGKFKTGDTFSDPSQPAAAAVTLAAWFAISYAVAYAGIWRKERR